MARRKRSQLTKNKKRRRFKKRVARKQKKEELRSLLDWLLPDDSIFAKMRLHGNTKWVPKCLVCLALGWAFSESKCLTDAFVESKEFCQSITKSFVCGTYQGFMKALSKRTGTLIEILWPVLHQRMREIGDKYWRIGGWVPIAFDGSRSTTPRTVANEQAFCAKKYGQGKTAKYRKKKTKGLRRKRNQQSKPQQQVPQVWITLMWHMGLQLPWMWRLGPSNSSERAHVMDMIETGEFPRNRLFCGDAGFIGFPLWSAIIRSGGHFLVRVGANVSLLRESADYEIRKKGFVLCWPKGKQSKELPLRLRLVKVCIGKTKVFLLTNVLNEEKLSYKMMVKFYKMRWGIEVEFRGLKQTLARAKLRCRNDERVLAELNWSIMAMAVAKLFALKEQLAKPARTKDKQPFKPKKLSLANTMRAIRGCIRKPNSVVPNGEDLAALLRNAVTDDYQRNTSKKARYRPPNPDKKPLGDPQLRVMTRTEKKKLHKMQEKLAA